MDKEKDIRENLALHGWLSARQKLQFLIFFFYFVKHFPKHDGERRRALYKI